MPPETASQLPPLAGSSRGRRRLAGEIELDQLAPSSCLSPPTSAAPNDDVGLRQRVWKENKKLWIVAGPAIFTRSSMFAVSVITQAFIGHIGSAELAACALVFTVLLRFANGVILGMSSALQTLCGQAYGAKQNHILGIYLQRSWIIMLATSIVLLPLFIFTTPILRLLGQDEFVAVTAGPISLWFIPIIFSYVFSFSFQMYLQAQSKNIVVAYFWLLSLTLHVLLSWLMVSKFSLGVKGAMGSMIVALWVPVIGQFVYVMSGKCNDTWKGFSLGAFSDLGPMIRLSLSSGAMICLELWYTTILVLLTGHLKDAEIALNALSICLNITGWEIMIAFGFLAAASVRVSNELGAGSAKDAKFSIMVVVSTSFSIGLVLFLTFLLLRGKLALLFTKNMKVTKAVADLSPLLGFAILLNSLQPVLSGVVVGAGWQNVIAYVNVACYYVIGVPIGIGLGYLVGYHVKGIWLGMLIGIFVYIVILACIICRTNWAKQVAVAQARVNRWLLEAQDGQNDGEEAVLPNF